MILKLSSVRITFYTLLFLILLMGAGIPLSAVYKDLFARMNNTGIFPWMASAWGELPLLVIWFLAVCLTAGLLLINALCCSFSRLLARARKAGTPRRWVFFILHCLFILVLSCHGLILATGSKQGQTVMSPGQAVDFGPFHIRLDRVVFKDDPAILEATCQERRTLMTAANIHIRENFAAVTLFRDGQAILSRDIWMLSPLRLSTLQVTLTDFIPKDDGLAVDLTLSRNIINILFFPVYAIMILALAGYTLATWHSTREEVSYETTSIS